MALEDGELPSSSSGDGAGGAKKAIEERGEKRTRPPHSARENERRLKKKKKKLLNKGRGTKKDCYYVYGSDAKPVVEINTAEDRRIRIRDVQVSRNEEASTARRERERERVVHEGAGEDLD